MFYSLALLTIEIVSAFFIRTMSDNSVMTIEYILLTVSIVAGLINIPICIYRMKRTKGHARGRAIAGLALVAFVVILGLILLLVAKYAAATPGWRACSSPAGPTSCW